MVEQNARRCLQVCDRAYVLDQGRNAYTGTGRELLGDPKVIELYLGTLARNASTRFDDAEDAERSSTTRRPDAAGPGRAAGSRQRSVSVARSGITSPASKFSPRALPM